MGIDKVLNKEICINASAAKVWDALVNPEIIKEWLFGTNTISEWKVGSQILFTGSWDGLEYEDKGTILQFEVEKVFQYSYWSSFSNLPDSPENYSSITFELSTVKDLTELKLTQTNFTTETAYDHSNQNWESILKLMKSIIEK